MSTAYLITLGLVASRLGGVMMIMPAFGARGIPKLAKVLCLLATTLVVGPTVGPYGQQ